MQLSVTNVHGTTLSLKHHYFILFRVTFSPHIFIMFIPPCNNFFKVLAPGIWLTMLYVQCLVHAHRASCTKNAHAHAQYYVRKIAFWGHNIEDSDEGLGV